MKLQPHRILQQMLVNHVFGNDGLDGIDNKVEQGFPDIIAADEERNNPHGNWIDKRTEVATVFFTNHRNMKLGDNGETFVLVDDVKQRGDIGEKTFF